MILIDEKVKKYEAKVQEKKTAIFEFRQKLNFDKEDVREEIENCKYDVRLFESFIRDLKEINAECETKHNTQTNTTEVNNLIIQTMKKKLDTLWCGILTIAGVLIMCACYLVNKARNIKRN